MHEDLNVRLLNSIQGDSQTDEAFLKKCWYCFRKDSRRQQVYCEHNQYIAHGNCHSLDRIVTRELNKATEESRRRGE